METSQRTVGPAPYGPWLEHEPGTNKYEDRAPGSVHLRHAKKNKSWRLIIDHHRGVSLYAPGFYTLPMALRHCWKQIRAWMALGSRGGCCGARCVEFESPFCSAAVLQESASKPASACLRREQKPLMLKTKFPPFSSLVMAAWLSRRGLSLQLSAWPWRG